MSTRSRFSREALSDAVASCTSMAEALRKLGMDLRGGYYTWMWTQIKRLRLDTSHWKGQGHLRGKTHGWTPSVPIEAVLVEHSPYNRQHLKKRLIKGGLLKNQCYVCGIESWENRAIQLHLDHANGIRDDNRLCNLRLLCPNCHSQTDTYCGRALRKPPKSCPGCGVEIHRAVKLCGPCRYTRRVARLHEKDLASICPSCGGPKGHDHKLCRSCSAASRLESSPKKINWPSMKMLQESLQHMPCTRLAKLLGVSDKAIKKHMHKRSATKEIRTPT